MLSEEQYELHPRWLRRRLWKGIISLSSKSTAILTAIMSNSASHFGGRNGFTGGGKFFPRGGNFPPRYIVKKGTANFGFSESCTKKNALIKLAKMPRVRHNAKSIENRYNSLKILTKLFETFSPLHERPPF
jgi:hypothetical protein